MLTLEELKDSSPSESAEAFDPYLYHVEMPHKGVYYPLGYPLELITNSEEVIAAANESWALFEQQFRTPPLQLRFGVTAAGSDECPPAPLFRAQYNVITGIADAANFCISDIVHGRSFAWLTQGAALHRSYLRYHYLEAAALAHIANRFSAPIHAGCVELDGHGVLLCGDSGAGKSSLSFACARAGWTYITDDASFLLHSTSGRNVVGNCHLMRLRPSAAELFAEVVDKPLTPRAGGKPSIELFTATLPGITRNIRTNVDYVVFLNRHAGTAQELVPFPRETARKYMIQRLSCFNELRGTQIESLERLLTARVLEIRYRDLDWAVDRLARLVKDGE